MDVLALRDQVVDDYKCYIESFARIRDKRIDQRHSKLSTRTRYRFS